MLEIKSPADLERVLAADVALIDFWAPWCGPCRMMTPTLAAFAEANPDVLVAKVDIDDQPALASAFRVRSIPTLIALHKGEHRATAVGAQSPSQLGSLVEQARD